MFTMLRGGRHNSFARTVSELLSRPETFYLTITPPTERFLNIVFSFLQNSSDRRNMAESIATVKICKSALRTVYVVVAVTFSALYLPGSQPLPSHL